MRRYNDPIDVRFQPHGPVAFLWRRRLYVVRVVLSCWQERDSWWERVGLRADQGREQQVWRVEAGRGRAAGTGVYDLAEPVMVGPSSGEERPWTAADEWRLLRALD